MKRSTFLAALAVAPFCQPCIAADPPPTAEEIMRLVRLSYALQDSKLTGKLRDSSSGKAEPFELTMTQMVIRFFFKNPNQIVHLDLATSPPTLREVKPDESIDVPMSKYGESVRGFGLNYEDLSLRFLYWPKPELIGEENVALGQRAWKVRVVSPDGLGPYQTVDIWVHQGSGGMAQMEGFDRQGISVRKFKITKLQKSGDTHIPEQMRIESFDPATGKKIGLTYMEFDKPEKK
jgi:Outer membrane lipoprotein-sorting protein